MEKTQNKSQNRVAVAMSGGVDSSVCAYLVLDAGYDAFGATMKLCDPSVTTNDGNANREIQDAAKICRFLNIPHKLYDFETEFRKNVIDNFVNSYINGKTPNPCVECNRYLKFGALLDAVKNDGADFIATGHYARAERDVNGRFLLRKAADSSKDQSYVLWSLDQNKLSRCLFPLGNYTKSEIRNIASEKGFINARKSDSQDICFVPDGDYASFITNYSGYIPKPGNYIDEKGNILGTHKGVIHYTVGQRKGLGISMGRHIFVCDKNPENNTVTLGDEDRLFKSRVVIKNINLIPFDKLSSPIKITAKVRYRQRAVPALAEQTGNDEITLMFDSPQRAPAPGQSAVMYDGEYVIGGGIIT